MPFDVGNAMSYLIDTAKAIRRIEATGLANEQAEAIVEIFSSASEQLATKADIDHLRNETNARFDGIDARFDGIDARFEGIDARFEGIDARFDGINARLDSIDDKIETAMFKQRVWLASLQAAMTAVVIAVLAIML